MHRFRRDVEAAMGAGKFKVNDVDVVASLIGAGVLALVNGRLSGVLGDEQVKEGLALLITHLGITPDKARKLVAQPIPTL